jgi:hypothetical protein
VTPLQSIDPKKMTPESCGTINVPKLNEASFKISRIWKRPRYPPTGE